MYILEFLEFITDFTNIKVCTLICKFLFLFIPVNQYQLYSMNEDPIIFKGLFMIDFNYYSMDLPTIKIKQRNFSLFG